MSLENKLLAMRKEAQLTQEAVAESLNTTRQTISNWETGVATPNLVKAQELVSLYGYSLKDLEADIVSSSHFLLDSWIGKVCYISQKNERAEYQGTIIKVVGRWITLEIQEGRKKEPKTINLNIENVYAIREVIQ